MGESFAISCAANLASKLVESLVAPIGRQFGYVLCFKSYVEDLAKKVKELENVQKRGQLAVQEAEYRGKTILDHIKKWLDSVEKETPEAHNLLKQGRSAENACFHGLLPNPVLRHPIGRKARRITKLIQDLIDESQNFDLPREIGHERPPIGVVTFPTSSTRSVDDDKDDLKSRASIKKSLFEALADDKVRVVGVWGLPGVGKSRLLADIDKRVRIDRKPFDLVDWKPFDLVVMIKLSRDQNIRTIQEGIIDALGRDQIKEETPHGRACHIRERLETGSHKNILIIIDDLWEKLELKDVGIPYGDNNEVRACKLLNDVGIPDVPYGDNNEVRGKLLKDVGIPYGDNNEVRACKLLLSSRNRGVLLHYMGSDPPSLFQLNELEPDEARTLFERTVGDKVNIPEYKACVDGVVKNCGGLPFTIVPLAKRLKHQYLPAWRNASTNRDLSNEKLLVESSYKGFEDERIRLLFLVCALSSGRISRRDSLLYCMGLNLLKKFSETIEKARDQLFVDLQILQDASLLQVESQNTEWLRMHDIIVDVAISLRDKLMDMSWSALVWRKGDHGYKECSEDDLKNCTAISFSYVGIDELPEKLDCPNLRILMLFNGERSLKIPESFFGSTEKLQVLVITDLSVTSLPSSVASLENLKSLSLDDCNLEDVTVLGKLKRLQFLSLRGSGIARLPKEIRELTELRFLDLRMCFNLKIIDPGVLGRLVNLEDLYIDSFRQWEAEDESPRSNASLIELKNMKKLRTLYITIPRWANLPSDLSFGNLNKHKIQIGSTRHWSAGDEECNILKLNLDSGYLLHGVWMQRFLQLTHDLHLEGSQDGKDSVHKLCTEGFQQLKRLCVQNNSTFKCIVDSTRCPAFTELESLFLENLKGLENICRGALAPESLSKLSIVKVENCCEIKHAFSSSMVRIFLQLEEIRISKCHLMEQIITDTEVDEDGDKIDDDPNHKSCKLRRLTLQNLPKMTSFCKTMDHRFVLFDEQQASFPRLESLTLAELPKLEEIWNSQYPSAVGNLKFLEVKGCTSLSSIIPSNLLIKLQDLEAITIEKCQLIREVFHLEEFNENVEIMGQLTRLTLNGLPRLENIWNKNPRGALCFQNLRALRVQNCENLRFLFSSSMAKALVQIKEIEVASCVLMEEIMDMQEEELEEVSTTNTLEFPLLNSLSLLELPNLKMFSHGKYSIHCPSLTKLTISSCPKMMTFASSEGRQQSATSDTDLQQAFNSINSGLSLPGFFNEKVLFPKLEELKLSSMCQLKRIWHDQLHNQSFCKLTSLIVEFCENLSNVFPSNSLYRMQSLNTTEVVGCCSLEALFEPIPLSSEKRQKPLVLNALKKMKLLNLPRLTSILKSHCKVTLAFPSLMEVNVRRCHSLPYLFSSATAKNLDQLVQLDVSYCNNLRGIVAMEEGEATTVETLNFQQLGKLKLGDLENLISFRSATCANGLQPLFDEKLAFPKLEELHIEGAQQEDLWNDKILPESFCRLKILKVKQCHNLINVIPPFMWKRLLHYLESLTIQKCPHLRNLVTIAVAKNLGQLQHLSLSGCGEMEYIVAKEEEKPEEAADNIVMSHLVTLYLYNMPKLKSFYQGNHISEWPALKEFTIENCKVVEVILGDASCRKLEGTIPIQKPLLLVKKVEFPNMESMKISHMDNMKKIWLDDLTSNAFSKLKTLVVEHCEKLPSIFSSHIILTRFQNLEELTVTNCEFLEVVYHSQGFDISETHSASDFQLRKLVLKRLPKMKHVWSGLAQGGLTFGRLKQIVVDECESLKSLFPSLVAKSMTQLEYLVVQSCGVEEIIAEEDGGGTSASDRFFSQLTKLALFELPKLKSFFRNSHTSRWPLLRYLQARHYRKMRSFSFPWEIQSCQGTIVSENQSALFSFEKVMPRLRTSTLTREDVVMTPQHYTFPNLSVLILSCYHDEKVYFPSDFLLHRFPNLEWLAVECSSFEEIFPEDASGLGGAIPCGGLTHAENPLQALRNLSRLYLRKLYNLRRVWKDGSLMAEILNQIKYLWLDECPSLSILFPSPISFQRLTILRVEDCVGLVHVVTCSVTTSLVHLESLTLRNCGAIEDVVTDDGNGATEISFPRLSRLTLDGLPSLESFSPTDCAFRFPSLCSVTVKQCPKLNIFCKGALRTPELHKLRLFSDNDYEERWEGDLNTTIRTLST